MAKKYLKKCSMPRGTCNEIKRNKREKKSRSKSIRADSTWGVLSIEKIAERCLLGPSARVTLNRRSYGRMEKNEKYEWNRWFQPERRNATTRFARPLEAASNSGFIRMKVSRLTPRRADMLHERSVRGIAHIAPTDATWFNKAISIADVDRRNVARYTYEMLSRWMWF